jgi:hypothetical protein
MDLREIVEKGADLLGEMIGFAAERLTEPEVGAKAGAGRGEKSAERPAHRNGHRERDWQTRAGNVELPIPKLRAGSYFPSFPEPRRAAEKALVAVIRDACAHGASTRAPWTISCGPWAARGSPGARSAARARRSTNVSTPSSPGPSRGSGARRRARTGGATLARLRVDAACLKVRQNGRIVSVAATIAVGVNMDGRREVPGLSIGASEAFGGVEAHRASPLIRLTLLDRVPPRAGAPRPVGCEVRRRRRP